MSATDHPTLPAFRITPEAVRATRRKTAQEYARDHDLTMLGNGATRGEALAICARILARGEDKTYRELMALRAAMRRHGLSQDLIIATWRRHAGVGAEVPAPLRIGRRGR